MDPNATLAKLRAALRLAEEAGDNGDAMVEAFAWQDVVEAAEALDTWLSKGGFLPSDWETR